jgi:hypothetical protein
MVLMTFESIYGRTLYEPGQEGSDGFNEAGIYKVTTILSE